MKGRIISTLKDFTDSKMLRTPNSMFESLSATLGLTPVSLQERAQGALTYIAHNYHDFNVSTIDKFTQKVVRTFAQDLKLSHNFEVTLDTSALLTQAVDRFISKAGSDTTLTKTMLDFAFEKVTDDKSADIGYDFHQIAQRLVSENDIPILEQIGQLDLKDHIAFKATIRTTLQDLHKQIKSVAQAIFDALITQNIDLKSFARGTLPNHFKKIADGQTKGLYNNTLEEQIESGEVLNNNASIEDRQKVDQLLPEIQEAFRQLKTSIYLMGLYQNFLSNITPLSVLGGIEKELEQIKLEQNFLLISEFNTLISKHLKEEPTAFIYERLGEKYSHFFIDEFQDTSVKQWENLLPLLSHSLASTGSSVTIVGDSKQAIYRWRGGKVEQFMKLSKFSPFQVPLRLSNLPNNYRSDFNIVDFNNQLFNSLATKVLSDKEQIELYQNSYQNPINQSGGFVSISFIDAKIETKTQDYCKTVLERVEQCQIDGFDLGDIVVLVRRNKEGVAVANYLTESDVPVVSSESLILSSSPEVRLIVAVMSSLQEPGNHSHRLDVLTHLGQTRHKNSDWHDLYSNHIHVSDVKFFNSLAHIGIKFCPEKASSLSLYELVEEIIICFELNNRSDAYIQYFLDEVLQFMSNQSLGVSSFLEYYKQHESKLSIVGVKQSDAVQIMTIHAAKGLEFPIVIFPFAEQNIYKEPATKLWYDLSKTPFDHMRFSLVNVNKDLPLTGEQGKLLYDKHRSDMELDNLNLLYVALTRAENQLHIIGNNNHQSSQATFSGFLKYFLEQQGRYSTDQTNYAFGENNQSKTKHHIDKEIVANIKCQMRSLGSLPAHIITNASLIWDSQLGDALEKGNLLHWYMSQIKQATDIPFASEVLINTGMASDDQKNELEDIASQIIDHPALKIYYDGRFEAYNEKEIITPEGKFLRPDRINILSKHEAVIIDYKSSQPQAKDQDQVNGYRTALNKMGFDLVKNILIYVNEEKPLKIVSF